MSLNSPFRPLAQIDRNALRHNLDIARRLAPNSRTMAVIKANAYGHGMLRVARALACSSDALAVARVHEGVELRDAGIPCPVTVLEGFFDQNELTVCRELGLNPVLHHQEQLRLLEASRKPAPDCWLKLDTGMHRLGFLPAELAEAIRRFQQLPGAPRAGFLTHFACADDPANPLTRHQIEIFYDQVPTGHETSLANSAAILGPESPAGDWIRPGIMLYGASPLLERNAEELDLRPVMTLQASLIAIHSLRRGDAIGYGSSWQCPEDMSVGVAGIGYADGYPRHLPSGTPVLLNQRNAPLVGRVSMDMITIDLRQHPEAKIGDRITLWGRGLPIEQIAEAAGTISYELLCSVGDRVILEDIPAPQQE